MRKTAPLLFISSVMLCFLSCKQQNQEIVKTDTKEMLHTLKMANEELMKSSSPLPKLIFWKKQLLNPKYVRDQVILSKIHYNMAGVYYAMNEIDSLKTHMEIAWELMEGEAGYDEIKVLLNSGLGNVAHMEEKLHQENYYYNQAAQMLNADTAVGLAKRQKVGIYFSAAQSCDHLKQFDNAFGWNYRAMELLSQIPDDRPAKFRAYSQMASCFSHIQNHPDSLLHYLKKMERIYKQEPDEAKARFLYDRKAVYFDQVNQSDQAIFYRKKALLIDEEEESRLGKMAGCVQTANLYTSYADLAASFLKNRQVDSAGKYLVLCEKFERKYPGKADEGNFVVYRQNLINYLFAIKDYAGAEKQQNLLMQQYKSLYENENAATVAEMATVYQLIAKDKSIHTLNETVGETRSRLQSNRLWLLITTLAALLSISVLFLLYYFQKQRKQKNETERIQLEQRLLRTQMEPHFIFNILSALQSFVRFDEKEKSLKYLNQFGKLLRSSLELSRESQVPLSEEISALENYLSLQQMRYDNAFSYAIHVHEEEDTESIYLPPMLIQPFVENSILHGFDQGSKNGKIDVDFDISEKMITVTINDNGKGINENKIDKNHKSLSTAISKERLSILAKESGLPAGISVKSKLDEGTTVILIIPATEAHPRS